MEEPVLQQPELVGREEELNELSRTLQNAVGGKGSTILLSGEAGIGKTRLVSELMKTAESEGVKIIQSWCLAESLEPLMPVKTGLRQAGLFHLISGEPPPFVVSAYLVNEAGMLIAKVEREESELDSDIFASMLKAVGDFVKDSLSMMGKEGGTGLNLLGYENYKILVQTSDTLSLAIVIEGNESEFLIHDMKKTLAEIGNKLDDWGGDPAEASEFVPKITWYTESGKYDGRFLVDSPQILQENLFDNALLGLQRFSADIPLLLFLDDLQWADASTLAILHYLARNTRDDSILILGTYRPEDIVQRQDGSAHPLETIMQNMSREGLIEKLELERLGPEDTQKVIGSMLGKESFDPPFLDKIYQDSGGTPLFILEVIKLLVEDGVIAQDEGTWKLVTDVDKLDIPTKVYDVVKRRLDRLMKEQREILECAAVIGEDFESEIVGNVIGVEKIRLLKDLSEIEKSHQLIHYLRGKYRFDHGKIREVLYNGIGEELRREYHRIAGDKISELYKDDPDVNVLAYHYYEAGDDRAGEYLVRAGDAAMEKYANEEALKLYENALEFLDDAYVYESLGDVYMLVGEFAISIDRYNTALAKEPDNRKKATIHKKISTVYTNQGDFQKSKEESDRGLELLKEECLESAQLLESQGWVYMRTGDYEKSGELLMKSLRIAEGLQDKKAIAQAHHTIGSMCLNKGEFDNAHEHLETALRIREEIDEVKGQQASLNNIGVVYWNQGDIDKALEYYELSLEINEKIGHKWGLSTSYNNIGLVHSEKGELDKALEYYGQSFEMDEKLGDKSGIASALNNIGNLHNRKGETEKALEIHERSLRLRENIGDKAGEATSHINIGNVLVEKGDPARSTEHYKKALGIGNEIGDQWLLGHIYFSLARSVLELGETETAFEHARKALQLSEKIGAKRELGMSHNALALAYREKGQWDKSAESFEEAITILEEIRDKSALARVYYEAALLYKAKGETDEARAKMEKALSMSKEMGMKLWVEKTRKALEDLD